MFGREDIKILSIVDKNNASNRLTDNYDLYYYTNLIRENACILKKILFQSANIAEQIGDASIKNRVKGSIKNNLEAALALNNKIDPDQNGLNDFTPTQSDSGYLKDHNAAKYIEQKWLHEISDIYAMVSKFFNDIAQMIYVYSPDHKITLSHKTSNYDLAKLEEILLNLQEPFEKLGIFNFTGLNGAIETGNTYLFCTDMKAYPFEMEDKNSEYKIDSIPFITRIPVINKDGARSEYVMINKPVPSIYYDKKFYSELFEKGTRNPGGEER